MPPHVEIELASCAFACGSAYPAPYAELNPVLVLDCANFREVNTDPVKPGYCEIIYEVKPQATKRSSLLSAMFKSNSLQQAAASRRTITYVLESVGDDLAFKQFVRRLQEARRMYGAQTALRSMELDADEALGRLSQDQRHGQPVLRGKLRLHRHQRPWTEWRVSFVASSSTVEWGPVVSSPARRQSALFTWCKAAQLTGSDGLILRLDGWPGNFDGERTHAQLPNPSDSSSTWLELDLVHPQNVQIVLGFMAKYMKTLAPRGLGLDATWRCARPRSRRPRSHYADVHCPRPLPPWQVTEW